MTPADRRAAVVQAALAVVGMGAHDPEAYLDLVGPGESAEVRRAMLTMSGCALVAAGVLRRAGLRTEGIPAMAPPYRIGSAVSRLLSLAQFCGAWRSDRHMLPSPGDIVLVKAPEHVFIVTAVTPHSTITKGVAWVASAWLESVDGGQLDAQGRQVVRRRERAWAMGARWLDQARDDGAAVYGLARQVVGWIDVGALPIASQAERDEVEVYGV